jgi:hypothetical protein
LTNESATSRTLDSDDRAINLLIDAKSKVASTRLHLFVQPIDRLLKTLPHLGWVESGLLPLRLTCLADPLVYLSRGHHHALNR